MSRWMEDTKDGTGKTVYIETLKDEKGCRYEINEVCCLSDCEMCCDYPDHEYCANCRWFTPERPDDIAELRKGIMHKA